MAMPLEEKLRFDAARLAQAAFECQSAVVVSRNEAIAQ